MTTAPEKPTRLRVGQFHWEVRTPELAARLRGLLAAPDQALAHPDKTFRDTVLVTLARITLPDGRCALLRRTNYGNPRARWRDAFRRPAPLRAFHSALALEHAGIPTPRVWAAGVMRSGLLPRTGYLLVEEVPHAVTLAGLLEAPGALPTPRTIRQVADVIARLHNLGWRHGDLTINNVLLDGERRPWFIDLERARSSRNPVNWRQAVEDFHRFARHVRGFRPAARLASLRLLKAYCAQRGWAGREREFARTIAGRLRRKWAADDLR